MPTINTIAVSANTVVPPTDQEHYRAPDTTTVPTAKHVAPNHMTHAIGNAAAGTVTTE